MAIVQISKIQHRTGANSDLPQLDVGEIGFATDERKLYIGNDPLVHPPLNTGITTQTEILTEFSSISFKQIDGVGDTVINISEAASGQVMGYDGYAWTNKGGDKGGLINLGRMSNVKIAGGTNGYFLQTDGLGNLTWATAGSLRYEIASISKSNPCLVTTTEENLLTSFMQVTIVDVGGMQEQLKNASINGGSNQFYIKKITNNSFELYSEDSLALIDAVDSTGFPTAVPMTGVVTSTLTIAGSNIPGGANRQIQFNDGNAIFNGTGFFTYDKETRVINIGSELLVSNEYGNALATSDHFYGPLEGAIGLQTPNEALFTSLTALNSATFDGPVEINADLNQTGNTTLSGNINVGTNATIAGDLQTGTLSAGGVVSDLTPVDDSTYNLGSPTSMWKDLYLSGSSFYLGEQTITSNTTHVSFSGNVYVTDDIEVINVVATGNLDVAVDSSVGGNLSVQGYVDVASTLNVASDTTVGGELGVAGNGAVAGNLLVSQNTSVAGNLEVATNVAISGNLSTVGNVTAGNVSTEFGTFSGNISSLNAELGTYANASFFVGDGRDLINLTGQYVLGVVGFANYAYYAGTITTPDQPTITSVGNLASLNVVGNVFTNGLFVGETVVGQLGLESGESANIVIVPEPTIPGQYFTFTPTGDLLTPVGSIANAELGTEYRGLPEGNVRLVGIDGIEDVQTFVQVSGDVTLSVGYGAYQWRMIDTGNIIFPDGSEQHTAFTDDLLSSFSASAQPNITSVGTLVGLNIDGDLSVTGKTTTATLEVTDSIKGVLDVDSSAQPNITSVGTLASLDANVLTVGDVESSINVDALTITSSSTSAYISVNELGFSITNSSNQLGDGLYVVSGNVGIVINNVTTLEVTDTVLRPSPNNTMTLGASDKVWSELYVTDIYSSGDATFGNVQATSVISNDGLFNGILTANSVTVTQGVTATGNIVGANLSTAGSITATGNIVGGNLVTNGALSVSGDLRVVNVSSTGNIVATGNLSAANITGTKGTFTDVFGTVKTASQPQITTLGTLTNLSVAGTVTAPTFAGNTIGIHTGAVVGTSGIFTQGITGNLVTAAQANITTVGTLANLSVSGQTKFNANLSVVGNITCGNVTATSFTGNGSGLTGVAALTAGTVTEPSQPTITEIGELTNLTVSGNVVLKGPGDVQLYASEGKLFFKDMITGSIYKILTQQIS